jgi:hypothetical protein
MMPQFQFSRETFLLKFGLSRAAVYSRSGTGTLKGSSVVDTRQ